MGSLILKSRWIDLEIDDFVLDGTLELTLSDGGDMRTFNINSDQAQQIIQHLQEQFGLNKDTQFLECLKEIINHSPNFDFHKNEKLEKALLAGEQLIKQATT